MKVDLSLLVPDWLLQYDRWREFLRVLEESINEVVKNVDDIRELYNVEKAKEFIVNLANNFGFGQIVSRSLEENAMLLDFQRGFIETKSSEEFFKRLLQLFGTTYVMRDLSKEILILSQQGRLSESYLQDGRVYRDGSIEVTVTASLFSLLKELERFVSAGVYVWYYVVSGVYKCELQVRTIEGSRYEGRADVEKVIVGSRVCYVVESEEKPASLVKMQGEVESWYFVLNKSLVI